MLALPLPILTFAISLVACVLVWRLELGNRSARAFFALYFLLIAVGTLLVGLRYGYGFDSLLVVQRTIPLFVGPAIFLAFFALTTPPETLRRHAIWHLGAATIAALLPQIFPQFRAGYDLMILASYLFYCTALFWLWRKGPDAFTHAPLRMVASLRVWILWAAGMLAVMLVFDAIIAISFALSRFDDAVWLISMGSVVSICSLTLAIIVFSSRSTAQSPAPSQPNEPEQGDSTTLEHRARALLTQTKLYLETDLTLERIAKRLHVPTRALSEAINTSQNVNVSQYVNGFRLEQAATLLETTDWSAKRVMEESGFLTRSNFYREFERVYAQSPLEYRKAKAGKAAQ